MLSQGSTAPSGELSITVIRGNRTHVTDPFPAPAPFGPEWPTVGFDAIVEHGLPRRGLDGEVNEWRKRNVRNLWRGAWRHLAAKRLGVGHVVGALWITVRRGDGRVLPLGLASMRVLTDVGAGYIVDAWQNLVELENMKFHGYGTGTTAEAVSQTALVTELTTEYNPNSTRPTGTTVEGATANVFRTVATLTPDSGSPVLREHGIFSQAATGGGVLLDRSLFGAVTLESANGDSMQTTYDFTVVPGS